MINPTLADPLENKPIFTMTVQGRPQRWMRPEQFGKRRYTNPKAEKHKKMVAELANIIWKGPPVFFPVCLSVKAIFQPWSNMTKKEKAALASGQNIYHDCDPDIDQIIKQVQDAMTGIVYEDDCQVAGYHNCLKRYGTPERTEISVYSLDQPMGIRTSRQNRLDKKYSKRLI